MNTYPRICHEIGLDCETCTESTARNLAKVCKGLRGKMIGQLFVQIYSDPACARMHSHFAKAYMDAAEVAPELRKAPHFERHAVAPTHPVVMAAVA